jgi:aerobic-type carbon monoxide dehydrogenase small subunit (CoxS/CutS family)
MATDLSGLFGGSLTPEEQQQQLLEARASQFAQLNPSQQLAFMGYKAGSNLGQGLAQAAGVDIQDPAIKRASMLRQMAQGIDVTTTKGLEEYANRLQQAGMSAEAAQLGQALAARKQQEIQASLAASKATREANVAAREDNLQRDLAALPPDASEEDTLAILRRYGDPKAVLASLEKKQAKQLEIDAKKELQKEKLAADEANKQRDREFKVQMAQLTASLKQSNNDVQRELIQARIDKLKDEAQGKKDKQVAAAENAIANADRVVAKVDEALPLVSGLTTGFGSVTSFIPGTAGANLKATVQTIKANLGFDRLQQMRDASPTGGALGQVSNKELDALEATVASLDLNQSPEKITQSLNQIKDHYSKWREAASGKLPADRQVPPPATTAPAAGNKQTSKGTKYTIIE